MSSNIEIEALVAERRAEEAAAEYGIAADALRVRRERAEAEGQFQQTQAQRRKQLADLEAVRLSAVADAQAAAERQVKALATVMNTTAIMARVSHQLSGAVPTSLSSPDLVSRLSRRWAAVLSLLPGHRSKFGVVEWMHSGAFSPNHDWRAAEAALMAPHLKPLMETTNDTKSSSNRDEG